MRRIYESPEAWRNAPDKRLTLFGMSGLGKTRISSLLREHGSWFHYSIDYRIGTAYMGEHIADNLKREAMRVPFLADLLRSDSIYIGSNLSFDNLSPLSTFLGKPGNPDKGGLPFAEYQRRQALHQRAEINALLDTPNFISRARDIYGISSFIADTGGSICEVVDPSDPEDPVMTALNAHTLMVWIEGDEAHIDALIDRFDRAPKPMYYRPEFMAATWAEYLKENNVEECDVDPDDFVRTAFASAIRARQPVYASMAQNWGVSVSASDVATLRDAADVSALVEAALGRAPVAA